MLNSPYREALIPILFSTDKVLLIMNRLARNASNTRYDNIYIEMFGLWENGM